MLVVGTVDEDSAEVSMQYVQSANLTTTIVNTVQVKESVIGLDEDGSVIHIGSIKLSTDGTMVSMDYYKKKIEGFGQVSSMVSLDDFLVCVTIDGTMILSKLIGCDFSKPEALNFGSLIGRAALAHSTDEKKIIVIGWEDHESPPIFKEIEREFDLFGYLVQSTFDPTLSASKMVVAAAATSKKWSDVALASAKDEVFGLHRSGALVHNSHVIDSVQGLDKIKVGTLRSGAPYILGTRPNSMLVVFPHDLVDDYTTFEFKTHKVVSFDCSSFQFHCLVDVDVEEHTDKSNATIATE